ncbi:MAG: LamG-like jellyroll fold domain-containing protein [Thiobacillus sp.]|nr:LamG-like jellyroll fold domain-containing protein [Thiobacillus sp.]
MCVLLPATGAAATLRGEYRFEDMQWTGAAGEVRDSSGNNRHGQALGTPLPTPVADFPARPGRPGTCSYGSFAGGALNLPVAANTTAGAKTTVSFWMYWNGANSVMPMGWSRHDLWLVSGHFGFNTGNSDVFGISSAGLANRWVHVIAEFTNGSVATNKLYIDGVAQTLTQRQGTPNLANAVVNANLRVSGWQADGNYRFSTRIDEVKVFDGVLTLPEATALFNETHACAPRLVQEWRFDECALGLLAGEVVDASGNGNHGTPQGAANTGAGRVCKAGIFNGVSPSRIKATTLFADGIVNDFTMAFWVNPTATHQLDAQSASGTAGTAGQRYVVYPAQGTDAWGAGHAGAGVSVGTNGISVYEHAAGYMPPLLVWSGAVSGWTHVAVVYQSRQPRLYVNGALVATGLTSTYANVHPGLRTSGGTPTNDGGLGGGNWGWFSGGIDEFRVYDGALDAAGVASIAAAPARACATCATLAKYRLEEGSWSGAAGEVQDASGNARHGRALGAPIPVTATVSPARTGDPGTCGYGTFAGGALDLPVAANTAAGAKTTVSFWMYWNGTNSVMPIGWWRHDLWLTSGNFGFNTASSDVFGISSAGLANRWVHVVAEFTNGSVATNKLYIDGVAQTLTQRQGTPNLANAVVNANLRVSGWQADSGYRFRTRIDEVEAFDGEMSLSQVLARYNETHPCSGTPSVAPSGFNAFETTTAGISGWIRTKVAASAFALDVVALNTTATAVETTFTGAVGVELVNAAGGGACGAYPLIRNLGTLTFAAGDQGRKTLAGISEPEAWPNARIRMRYPAVGVPTVTACSTDNFAIRPANFGSVVVSDANSETAGTAANTRILSNTAVTGGVVHKAGRPFRMAATALNAAGVATSNYTGTPVTTLTACVLPGSGCTLGALTPGTWATAAGTVTTTDARYSEVGAFAMKLTDTSFAAVDAADGSSAAEMTIESAAVNVGRFVPDHFDLATASVPVFKTFNDTTCATRSFTYVGQPFGYLTLPQATITAKNATGATTVNYSGALWKPTGVTPTYAAVSGTVDDALVGTPTVTEIGNGVGSLTANAGDEIAFVRTLPVIPFTADISLTMSIQDTAENAVTGNGTIDTTTPAVFSNMAFDAGNEIRFGQLVLSNAHGSELLNLPVPIETRFWNGAGFTRNTADFCTQLGAAQVSLANWQRDLNACETSVSLSGRFNAGRGNLRFSAPGAGNTGSVDLAVQLGATAAGTTCVAGVVTPAAAASQSWLQGRSSTGVYNQNPAARASFGLNRGNKPLIYLREMY